MCDGRRSSSLRPFQFRARSRRQSPTFFVRRSSVARDDRKCPSGVSPAERDVLWSLATAAISLSGAVTGGSCSLLIRRDGFSAYRCIGRMEFQHLDCRSSSQFLRSDSDTGALSTTFLPMAAAFTSCTPMKTNRHVRSLSSTVGVRCSTTCGAEDEVSTLPRTRHPDLPRLDERPLAHARY